MGWVGELVGEVRWEWMVEKEKFCGKGGELEFVGMAGDDG